MTDDKPATSDEATLRAAYEAYKSAVGDVTSSWNILHEGLGVLFAVLLGERPEYPAVSLAIWYSADSDRAQRAMLHAAITVSHVHEWTPRFSTATEDMLWLVERTNALAEQRNDAVHASLDVLTDEDGRPVLFPSTYSYIFGSRRARKLADVEDIMGEFDRCARTADALSLFVRRMACTLADQRRDWRRRLSWPDRPSLPDPKPRNVPRAPRRQRRTKLRPRPPRSSRA